MSKETRRKSDEIFEMIFTALTDEPQSIGKIAKKTGLHWQTIAEYLEMIVKVQGQKKVKVIEKPTLAWFIDE